MVRLVQLVEHWIVVLGVVGSSPTSHPKTAEMPSFLFYGERTLSLATRKTPLNSSRILQRSGKDAT